MSRKSVQRFGGYDMRKIKDLKHGSESERSRRALESELVTQIKASDIRIVDDVVSAPVGQHFPGVNDIGAIDQRSEEHTSELQSLMRTSYAVFCLNKKDNSYPQHKHANR